jgi:hypothetical protein
LRIIKVLCSNPLWLHLKEKHCYLNSESQWSHLPCLFKKLQWLGEVLHLPCKFNSNEWQQRLDFSDLCSRVAMIFELLEFLVRAHDWIILV